MKRVLAAGSVLAIGALAAAAPAMAQGDMIEDETLGTSCGNRVTISAVIGPENVLNPILERSSTGGRGADDPEGEQPLVVARVPPDSGEPGVECRYFTYHTHGAGGWVRSDDLLFAMVTRSYGEIYDVQDITAGGFIFGLRVSDTAWRALPADTYVGPSGLSVWGIGVVDSPKQYSDFGVRVSIQGGNVTQVADDGRGFRNLETSADDGALVIKSGLRTLHLAPGVYVGEETGASFYLGDGNRLTMAAGEALTDYDPSFGFTTITPVGGDSGDSKVDPLPY